MAAEHVGFRCPEELYEVIKRIGTKWYPNNSAQGFDRTQTVIKMLQLAAITAEEVENPDNEVVLQQSDIPGRLATLERMVGELMGKQNLPLAS